MEHRNRKKASQMLNSDIQYKRAPDQVRCKLAKNDDSSIVAGYIKNRLKWLLSYIR